jgi:hypothetical protein
MAHPTDPAIGFIVHYRAPGSAPDANGVQLHPSVCRAAVVTEVDQADPTRVGLAVFNPTGVNFRPLSEGGVPGRSDPAYVHHAHTWHEAWVCVPLGDPSDGYAAYAASLDDEDDAFAREARRRRCLATDDD